jgi:microcystin-dependent protein
MSDPFVAEIRIFAGNFAPTGWARCDGQLLPISQNTALFSLCGTNYGGNGKSTFALPDLTGRAPMFWGQGPGLSLHDIGETAGSDTVTLLASEIPAHTHALRASTTAGDLSGPSPGATLARSSGATAYGAAAGLVPMSSSALAVTGGSLPHSNLQPYLALTFIIALQGIFPPHG